MKKITSLFGTVLLASAMFVSAVGPASAATNSASDGALRGNVNGGAQGKFNLTVMDANSITPKPISGATVAIFDMSGQTVAPASADATDANGLFATMLDPGEYTIKVSAKDYDTQGQAMVIVPDEATNVTVLLQPTAPVPAPVPPATDPAPGSELQGKFTIFVFNAASITPQPIAGAEVRILDLNGAVTSTVVGVTDEYGRFVTLLDEGNYLVRVSAKGFDGYSSEVKIVANESSDVAAGLMTQSSPCLSCGGF